MGTRHLIGVVKNDEYKVAQYGQWDGYPSGQGLDILNFLNGEFNREVFEDKLNKVSWIGDEELKEMWVDCGADPNSSMVNMLVAEEFEKRYPENSRNTGSKILNIIQDTEKELKIDNSIDFASNSLFCEWAYVIDLDNNTFEVFEGFNEDLLSEDERFYSYQEDNQEYKPVKLVTSFDLNELPDKEQFLSNFDDE